jgi:hypothetical protein
MSANRSKFLALPAVLLGCALASSVAAQGTTNQWIPANVEIAQLDPAEYHPARIYRPGDDGGGMHIDIDAHKPVTVGMVAESEWDAATQHPGATDDIHYMCLREHVSRLTYVCQLPPDRPMRLVLRDERAPEHGAAVNLGSIFLGHAAMRAFVSPNDVRIQYYRWASPEFQWIDDVKEKYQLTPIMKVYGGLTADRDGEEISVKIKSPIPMAVALVPARVADDMHAQPETMEAALAGGACKQRGVQQLQFQCTYNASDGPQSLVLVPEPGVKVPNKKAQIEVLSYKCVRYCAPPPQPQPQPSQQPSQQQ